MISYGQNEWTSYILPLVVYHTSYVYLIDVLFRRSGGTGIRARSRFEKDTTDKEDITPITVSLKI